MWKGGIKHGGQCNNSVCLASPAGNQILLARIVLIVQTGVNYHKKFKYSKTHRLVQRFPKGTPGLDAPVLSSYLFCPNHSDNATEIKSSVPDTIFAGCVPLITIRSVKILA